VSTGTGCTQCGAWGIRGDLPVKSTLKHVLSRYGVSSRITANIEPQRHGRVWLAWRTRGDPKSVHDFCGSVLMLGWGKRHEQATRDDCRFCDPSRDSIRTTTRVTGHAGAVVSNRWYSGADSRSKKQLSEAHQAVVDRMQFPGRER
jgi:hypothetical protein